MAGDAILRHSWSCPGRFAKTSAHAHAQCTMNKDDSVNPCVRDILRRAAPPPAPHRWKSKETSLDSDEEMGGGDERWGGREGLSLPAGRLYNNTLSKETAGLEKTMTGGHILISFTVGHLMPPHSVIYQSYGVVFSGMPWTSGISFTNIAVTSGLKIRELWMIMSRILIN